MALAGAVLAAILGGVAWRGLLEKTPPAAPAPLAGSAAPRAHPPGPPTRTVAGVTEALLRAEGRPVSDKAVRREAGAELLASIMGGLMRSYGQDLHLTESEMKALLDSYVFHQQVRSAFEAEVAQMTLSSDALTILVPPYPKVGRRLYEMWSGEVTETLGAERADLLLKRIMPLAEPLFHGFGQDTQQIVVKMSASTPREESYEVTRTQTATKPRPSISGEKSSLFTGNSSGYTVTGQNLDGGEFANFAPYFRQLRDARR